MVILNGLKYACETCIKGHRSSACSHTDRPLFEIKKKGRPVTQCEHCRNLRRTRQVHVKCLCGSRFDDDQSEETQAKSKLPTPATTRLSSSDLNHATFTTDSPSLKTKAKLKSSKKAKLAETTSCNARSSCSSSPSHSSAPVTPPPLSAASTSSCCATTSRRPPDISSPHSTSTTIVSSSPGSDDDDTYTASLLDDLSRSAAKSINAVATVTGQHVHPFYNPNINAASFSWQSNVNLGSCSCGITCACPGCYEHSPSTSMILFSGENCPYSCTTCTACNGFGFTSHIPGTFIAPTHSIDHWRQSYSSSVVSTTPVISASSGSLSSSISALDKPTSYSHCCGGPCKCITCNCYKAKDSDELPVKIGFAVSGERGGCCTDSNPRVRYPRPPADDHETSSSASTSETATSENDR